MTQKFVSYYRVSTEKQGKSGLGLDAQRTTVETHVSGVQGQLIDEFIEVESGQRHDQRPQLRAAMKLARKSRATLIIAKLDRLSRNLAFLATLMESKIDFLACDIIAANRFSLHIMGAMAEHERQLISDRTKKALLAKKNRGEPVGNVVNFHEVSAKGRITISANADRYASRILPLIEQIKADGKKSYRSIAVELENRSVPTSRGGIWSAASVRNIILRMQKKAQSV